MPLYGLIGHPLTHSFSKQYFTEKFAREGLRDCQYDLYDLPDVAALPALLARQPDLRGLNVTIPHKQTVMPLLHDLDASARRVGAVNVINITSDGQRVGHNSDYYGFRQSLAGWLTRLGEAPVAALVLGSGGAARAVVVALQDLGIAHRTVSRQPSAHGLTYAQLDAPTLAAYPLIVNTTPVGTFPRVDDCPPLPCQLLTPAHLVYDLVYNPAETELMRRATARGARVHNGLEMLHLQAERAWEIWRA